MDNIKVSIIIPVYNVELYLEECLESALNQTLDAIEIICINDGSTDNSSNILKKYSEKYNNIKVINQDNKGLSTTRNIGIKEARGEFIYFLDSDDYIELNTIEVCYREAKKYNLDIITFDANIFFDENIEINEWKEKYDRKEILNSNILNGQEFYILSNKKGIYYSPVWLYFYKKEFIEKNNLFFYEGIVHEDEIYTSTALIKANSIKYINQKFFNRRIRENSIMTSNISKDRIIGNRTIANETYKLYLNNNLDIELRDILISWIRVYYQNSIRFCDILNCYELKNEIVKEIKENKDILNFSLDMQINSPILYYRDESISTIEPQNLFIVHTPYHILLATSISQSNEYIDDYNEIFINNTFGIKEREVNKLRKIFKKVHVLNNLSDLSEVYSLIGNKKYKRIFVNNESEIKTQYILNNNLIKSGEIIYIEDGTANYLNLKMKALDNKVIERYSKLLNIELENLMILGSYSKIKKRYFLYPYLVRKELLDSKESLEIDGYMLTNAINLFYGFLECGEEYNKNVVIALENSEFFNDEYDMYNYIKVINKIIVELDKNKIKVYIKYHPREKKRYLESYINYSRYIEYIESSQAIEKYYKLKNLYLISMKSTCLISFCKIFGKERAICINNLFNKNNDDIVEIFKKLNIYLPNDINGIINKIKNN